MSGKWLAALRAQSKKNEKGPEAVPSKPPKPGFGGFEGFLPGPFAKIIGPPDRSSWTAEDWEASFDERAAILEYDEGLPRSEAEALARQETDAARTRSRH